MWSPDRLRAPPRGGARELRNRLGVTHVTLSHRTEHGVEFVELDLLDVQLVQKVGGKGGQRLRSRHQPPQHRRGSDLAAPCRAPEAQAFGETRDDAHDEFHRRALPMQEGAVGFVERAVTGDTLKLPPELAAGMPLGVDVAASEPARIGAIVIRTALMRGGDGASTAPGEEHERGGGRTGRLGTRSAALLTRLAQRFVEASGEGLRLFGAGSSGLRRLEEPGRAGPGRLGPPDTDEEADQHASDQ